MKKKYFSMLAGTLLAAVVSVNAQTYSLNDMTDEQFSSGGTDVWSFERHDVNADTYTNFSLCDDGSTAVNFYDMYITERFNLYPIYNRPTTGTQYEVRRKAWYETAGEYVYVAAEYGDSVTVGTNLNYGTDYPDTLKGFEVYSNSVGINAAVTFTVPADGWYRADITVMRQDLWSGIGAMKLYSFFRYSDQEQIYSLGTEFDYGITKGIDSWAVGNEALYEEYLAQVPEDPAVNSNSGKPYRGLPTGTTKKYFYFYAKEGDKIAFEADARSTGNTENTPRGAYARTKFTNLTVQSVEEDEAINDSQFVNPYSSDDTVLEALQDKLTEAEDMLNGDAPYSLETLNALSAFVEITYQRLQSGAVLNMEVPGLLAELETLIAACRASEGGLKLQYTFDNVEGDVVPDASGQGNNGTLLNGASIIAIGEYNALDLGTDNGYLDMGANIGTVVRNMNEFTVSTYYRVDPACPLSGNGWMLFAFSTLQACTADNGEFLYYRVLNQSHNISAAGWNNATSVVVNTAPAKGAWQHVVVQQKEGVASIYVNGVMAMQAELAAPSEKFTQAPGFNTIGRPPFNNDNYQRQTLVHDFRLYNYAVAEDSITLWAGKIESLETATNYSTEGDYTELLAIASEYEAIANAAPIGTEAGKYSQESVDAFKVAIDSAKALAVENTSSQFKISAAILDLQGAYQTFTASIITEVNMLEEGLYYIKVGDAYYINNPGTAGIANDVYLTADNSGLVTGITDGVFNQVFTLARVTSLDPARYSIFSALDEDGIYRHLNENAHFRSSWGNPGGGTNGSDDDWRTFNLHYNGTAYAIQNAGRSASKGNWFYNATNNRLDRAGSALVFDFKFERYTDDISTVAASTVQIIGMEGAVKVFTEAPAKVAVYTPSGLLVAETIADGAATINLADGIYIVRVEGEETTTRKVIIN